MKLAALIVMVALLAALILCTVWATLGYADTLSPYTRKRILQDQVWKNNTVKWSESEKQDAAYREARSKRYEIKTDTRIDTSISSGTITNAEWIIAKGSQTMTLDEFVKSGQFCRERGGHKWWRTAERDLLPEEWWHPENYCWHSWFCVVCHRCRQKVHVKKEVEEWEN